MSGASAALATPSAENVMCGLGSLVIEISGIGLFCQLGDLVARIYRLTLLFVCALGRKRQHRHHRLVLQILDWWMSMEPWQH